jgi:uncharacterized integral membrane protein
LLLFHTRDVNDRVVQKNVRHVWTIIYVVIAIVVLSSPQNVDVCVLVLLPAACVSLPPLLVLVVAVLAAASPPLIAPLKSEK